jgi:hypothetical protein
MAADIDPRHRGYEVWGGPGGLRDSQGKEIGPNPALQQLCYLVGRRPPARVALRLGCQ